MGCASSKPAEVKAPNDGEFHDMQKAPRNPLMAPILVPPQVVNAAPTSPHSLTSSFLLDDSLRFSSSWEIVPVTVASETIMVDEHNVVVDTSLPLVFPTATSNRYKFEVSKAEGADFEFVSIAMTPQWIGSMESMTSVISTRELVRGTDTDGNKLLNSYAVVGLLGKGAYGKVKLAVNTATDEPVAIKIMNRKKLAKIDPELLKQEVMIMTTRRHPNLVKLHEVINDAECEKVYLVMEYMGGGTLTKTPLLRGSIPSSPPLDIPVLRSRFLDVLHGLAFLHSKNVIHMDIKPENILLDETGMCKLADFGVCSMLSGSFHQNGPDDTLHKSKGTPLFFAPEMIAGGPFHGKATDVWALGVTLFVYVYGQHAFSGATLSEYFYAVSHTEPLFPSANNDGCVPADLLDVMRRMLMAAPELRITVAQLIGHPFFNPNRVPLQWSVRVWKENKLSRCASDEERTALVARLHLRDNTSRRGDVVPPEVLMTASMTMSRDELFS